MSTFIYRFLQLYPVALVALLAHLYALVLLIAEYGARGIAWVAGKGVKYP